MSFSNKDPPKPPTTFFLTITVLSFGAPLRALCKRAGLLERRTMLAPLWHVILFINALEYTKLCRKCSLTCNFKAFSSRNQMPSKVQLLLWPRDSLGWAGPSSCLSRALGVGAFWPSSWLCFGPECEFRVVKDQGLFSSSFIFSTQHSYIGENSPFSKYLREFLGKLKCVVWG